MSGCCYAALWVEFYPKSYVDLMTVEHSGRIVSVWAKELNPGNWKIVNNKKIWYAMIKYSADCSYRKLKIRSYTSYDLKGQPVENYDLNNSSNWDDIIPDTVGEAKYNYFCSLK